MNYIDEIFKRANIQSIRNFLLYGTENIIEDTNLYEDKLKNAEKNLISNIHKHFSEKEAENIISLIYMYGTVNEEVYMEIGMQIGMILSTEIFQNLINKLKINEYELYKHSLKK